MSVSDHGSHDDPQLRQFHNVAVPLGTLVLLTLEQVPLAVNGTVAYAHAEIVGVDTTVIADASATFLSEGFRVAAGALTAFTANVSNKQVLGGAGSFAQDVSFTLVVGTPVNGFAPINILATGAAARTGNVFVRYWCSIARLFG